VTIIAHCHGDAFQARIVRTAPLIAPITAETEPRDDDVATFGLETKNVLYSSKATVYRRIQGVVAPLKLSMKR
jgi:hypothetical protein